jgi:HEPN/Toprim N-terminal domain 1
MGSYAELYLGGNLIGSTKNDINEDFISIFRPEDKAVLKVPLNQPLPEVLEHYKDDEYVEEYDDFTIVYYDAPVNVIKDRLTTLGYTLNNSKEGLINWINGHISHYKKIVDEHNETNITTHTSTSYVEHCIQILSLLETLTSEIYIQCLSTIHENNLQYSFSALEDEPYRNTHIGLVLNNDLLEFPALDCRISIRLALEGINPNERLVYDLTDMIAGDLFDSDDDLTAIALHDSKLQYNSLAKTIILTEGRTDSWILNDSLQILYPHLANYYSFLEFDNSRVGGGVGNLSNIVKAFSAAGVANRVIALFDNDTAAHAAISNLNKVNLLPTIKVLTLPSIELLRNYPTIGPNGQQNMDVNGIAASIELYFGEEVLKLNEEELTPIQWTGYNSNLKKYQGEVLRKKELQDKFKNKLEKAKNKKDESVDDSWDDIRNIFTSIFHVFENEDKNTILSLADNYFR